jgi:hypothetical protein
MDNFCSTRRGRPRLKPENPNVRASFGVTVGICGLVAGTGSSLQMERA